MKIFIIEDEPAIREEITQLFEKYGYQCASSSDFQHIAETALSSGADLILLDINLPYQDGFQVCSAFCTLWRSQMRFRAVALRSITAARF